MKGSGYKSPLGFYFSPQDLMRMEIACVVAARRMGMRIPKKIIKKQGKEIDEKLQKQSLMQQKFDEDCRVYGEEMTCAEVRDVLCCALDKIIKLSTAGIIIRRRIPHTRGGAYAYNTRSVFKYYYKHKFNFVPAKQHLTKNS